jgi:hypothetical protein
MHRDDKDGKLRADRLEILDQFKSALIRQGYVNKREIWFAGIQSRERLCGVFGFATDLEIRLIVYQVDEAGTRHGVIIDD